MRVLYPTVSTLLLAACSMGGELNITGQCPTGEVCSPTTPQGLTFDGAAFGDQLFGGGLHPTAVGGRQFVSINDPRTGTLLQAAFTASTDGTAYDVLDQSTGVVNVGAHAPGHDRLRIADPASGALLDRVGLDAAAIASMTLKADVFGELGIEGPTVAVWTGKVGRLTIALRDDAGNRLVDQSLTVTTSTGARAWDSIIFDAQTGGAVALTVTRGAGEVTELTVPIVDHADDLIAQPPSTPDLHVGDLVCFTPHTNGVPVLGAPYQFTVSGPATLADPTDWFINCAMIKTVGTGNVTVSARVGALSASVTLPTATNAKLAEPADAGPTPGEIAATAASFE